MSRIRQTLHHHRRTLLKTASYYVIHVTVAAAVAYAVTRNLWAALTLSLLVHEFGHALVPAFGLIGRIMVVNQNNFFEAFEAGLIDIGCGARRQLWL